MDKKEREFYSEYIKAYPNTHIRDFSQYNESKMKKEYTNCKPTRCWRELLSKDNIYITLDIIKEKCNCSKKSVCFEILRLLKDWNQPEADTMLENL